MQMKIFWEWVDTKGEAKILENGVNTFLENIPNDDVLKVESLSISRSRNNIIAVLVWLKETSE